MDTRGKSASSDFFSTGNIISLNIKFYFKVLQMKKNIIYILVFSFNYVCVAQQNVIDINEIQNPYLVNFYGNNILISIVDKEETNLSYLNNSLDTLWEVKLASKHKDIVMIKQLGDPIEPYNFTVVSPSKKIFHNVQIKRKGFYNKPHYITTINNNGESKEFVINAKEEFGKNLIAAFCDEEFLYYITSESGNEMHKKKKQTEKLVLNRFDNKDFRHQKFLLSTPNLLNEHSTFWSYLGQANQEKFFLSKTIDPKIPKVYLNVMVFNKEGKALRKFEIDFEPREKFIRPVYLFNDEENLSYQAINFDHYFMPPTPPMTTSSTIITSGGFAGFIFDEKSKSFYLYGLLGPKPFKKVGSTYDGYYISKYDIDGNLKWNMEEPVAKDLADDKYFKVHARPVDRNISLRFSPNGNLNLVISGKEIDYNHIISSEGKLLGVKNTGFLYNSPNQDLKSEKYQESIDSRKQRKLFYKHYLMENGEVLLKSKKNGYSLLFF